MRTYETIFVTLSPCTWERLQRKLTELQAEMENDFEDDALIQEVGELEREVGARLQHIAAGSKQP